MGERITFSCKKCGYELTAPVGVGLASFNPMVIGELLKDEEREEWKTLSDTGALTQCFGEQIMASCEKCGGLSSIYCVSGQTADKNYLWGNICPTCGRKLKLLRDIHAITCPKCMDSLLDAEQTGLWD